MIKEILSKKTIYRKILLALIVLVVVVELPSVIRTIFDIGHEFGYNVTKVFID